jgi:hypothetical protein
MNEFPDSMFESISTKAFKLLDVESIFENYVKSDIYIVTTSSEIPFDVRPLTHIYSTDESLVELILESSNSDGIIVSVIDKTDIPLIKSIYGI